MANGPVTLWHNPRCSKSRETLELLRTRGSVPTVVDYQIDPPDAAQIDRALRLLGLDPRGLMRTNEATYTELGLDDAQLTRDQLITAMVAHPVLLQRPLVFANGKAAIGRPPEAVLAIL